MSTTSPPSNDQSLIVNRWETAGLDPPTPSLHSGVSNDDLDEQLCLSWIVTSHNHQPNVGKVFWSKVHTLVCAQLPAVECSPDSIESRWKAIDKSVMRFVVCVTQINMLNKPAKNTAHRQADSQALYEALYKKPFTMFRAYGVLQRERRWVVPNEGAKTIHRPKTRLAAVAQEVDFQSPHFATFSYKSNSLPRVMKSSTLSRQARLDATAGPSSNRCHMLACSETMAEATQSMADSIARQYANLERMSQNSILMANVPEMYEDTKENHVQ